MSGESAFGTAFKLGATEIAKVTNTSGPSLSLDTEDVTSHDSTDGWEEVVATILRSGTITLDNLDTLNESETMEDKLEIIKSISGHYEEIIKESVSIIRQYKGNGDQ